MEVRSAERSRQKRKKTGFYKEEVTFTNLLYKGKIGHILNTEGVFEYRDDIFAAAYKRAVFG